LAKSFFDVQDKLNPQVRLNTICPYFTMFPLSFPYTILRSAHSNDVVYDPFCGRGTTNYAARLRGLKSFGMDSNPVASAIAQAKLVTVSPREVTKLCLDILLHHHPKPTAFPKGDFWNLAYNSDTLVDICIIRDYLNRKPRLSKVEIALRAIMLGILHGPIMKTQFSYLSNQMPRTFSTKPEYSIRYWKKNKLLAPEVNVLELVKRKATYIFNELIPSQTKGKILLGDSRKSFGHQNEKFDWVITSPPYFGMASYEQDQWLRNWFMGGRDNVDYSTKNQLRHWSEKVFISDLRKVWTNAAERSNPDGRLVIRFGALPSKSDKSPSELLKESLTDSGWKLTTIRNAGSPKESIRQANQFKNTTGNYIEEIDAFAVLN
jgi:hypothetical protein